ncbi:MAG TPA: MFS transporter, partial [Acidobacteriaceae bacterium]|nr:MFS transporter [Acidobacteriaceae bacterium]
ESLAYPCYSRILASDVPQKMRGRANALLDAASKLGPALGLLLGGLLMVKFGWRIFFITLGVASLAWAVLWRYFTRRHPERADSETNIKISIRQALRSRSSWGTFAGHFCGNYVWFFLLLWLPTYLVEDKGLSLRSMTSIGSVAYFVIAFGTLCAGWFSDWRIGRGQSPTVVRKSVVVGGMLGSSLIVLASFIHSTSSSLCLLFVVCFAFGTYTSNHWAITQTIAGPTLAGRWTGLQNGIGNFSGIAAAWVTGEIATRTGSFRGAFAVTAVMAVTAALMWGLVVGPVRELSYEEA